MVCSPDGDIDFFDTASKLSLTLVPFLFIFCLDYVLRTSTDLMRENGLTLKKKKARSRRYPKETVTDADYTNDQVLLENTPAQAKVCCIACSRQQGALVSIGS